MTPSAEFLPTGTVSLDYTTTGRGVVSGAKGAAEVFVIPADASVAGRSADGDGAVVTLTLSGSRRDFDCTIVGSSRYSSEPTARLRAIRRQGVLSDTRPSQWTGPRREKRNLLAPVTQSIGLKRAMRQGMYILAFGVAYTPAVIRGYRRYQRRAGSYRIERGATRGRGQQMLAL